MVLFAVAYGLLILSNLIGTAAVDTLRFEMPEVAGTLGTMFMPIVLTVRLAFAGWLGWLIVWRRNNFAKWAVVALMALRLRDTADAWTGLVSGNPISILWFFATGVGAFALLCLFLPPSRRWFAAKGQPPVDASIFD